MFQKFFLSLFLTLAVLLGSAPAHAISNDKNLSVRLLPEQTQVKGGETITIGIEQTIRDGWHTYWSNPGDSGTAARIVWKGIEGIKPAAIQWPVPHRMPIGPLTNFGYEKKVVLLQDLKLPENLPAGAQTITADMDVLVCHEICIPETHRASFILNGDQQPSQLDDARTMLPIDVGWNASIKSTNGDVILTVETDTPSAFANLKTIELYPEEWGIIHNPAETRAEKKESTLILTHARGERDLSEVPISKFVIAYEDTTGHRKAVRVSTLDASAGGDINENSKDVGILKAIIFALLGGLILNLMPCVFPVLSMKALSLVTLNDKEAAKARTQGIAYTLGIITCFVLIAGILIALKASGQQVGWGFQLQHPAVTLFLAYLFFTLGLNLAGYFEINLGLSNIGNRLAQKGGMAGSFFTGVLATLVATPCTAPFMGAAMGYALTQSAFAAIIVFVALGFGLALPYLALCYIPSLRHRLPKPGHWMETFRQFLSFPMFATAAWLVWVLSQQISHMGQFAALLGMLAITLSFWLLKRRPTNHAAYILMLIAAIGSLGFVVSTFFTMKPIEKIQTATTQHWEDFTRVKLEEYLKGDNPVFVDMTAAWCITCKVNEKVAIDIESTQDLFTKNKVHSLRGDWTNQNPEITSFLEEYGRSGVPIYVYYGPRNAETGVRPEAIVLPQILTPAIVENAITNHKG